MADRIVTVATYGTVHEAHLAKNELEEAGIRTVLADEEVVGSLWHVGIAVGGVKVQVNESDLEKACEIINQTFGEAEEAAPLTDDDLEAQALAMERERMEDSDGEVVEDKRDEPVAAEWVAAMFASTENEREQCARKLFFISWLGLGIFPLAFYGLYLLYQILKRTEPLSNRRRFEAIVGGFVLIPGAALGLFYSGACIFMVFEFFSVG